jgi:phosphoglycolate phosphatase
MGDITVACLDMAGTTVADDGAVLAAFTAAIAASGITEGAPGYDDAMAHIRATMGQSKIEVFRHLLGSEERAQQGNRVFEGKYFDSVRAGSVTPVPGAAETFAALRAAGIKVCLATGFAPATRDAVLDTFGWRPLIDLALSPCDAGRGRPWPDMPLTALLRLAGGAVSELAVVGDTPGDIESGLRAGAGLVAGVTTGACSRDELLAAGAPHVLESVSELLRLLRLGPARLRSPG